MKIFIDAKSDDELVSDAYPMKLVDGFIYEFEAKMVTVGGDCGIANNDEDDGGLDDATEQKINIVHNHNLEKTTMDKKQYQTYIKSYMAYLLKRVKENGGDENAAKTAFTNFVKNVLTTFSEWDFYTSEHTMENYPEGMIIHNRFVSVSDTEEKIFFYYFKDALREEKC